MSFFGTIYGQEIDKSCPEKDLNLRLNVEYFFKDGSFLFYESNWQVGQNQTFEKINSLPFYQMYHLLGYEIPLGKNWAGGFGIRQNYFWELHVSALRTHLNHSGKISKFVFFKEFSLEHFWQNRNEKSYHRAGLRTMLGRDWRIQKHQIRSVFGYDLFKRFESENLAKNRNIQQTNLRMGADFFLKKLLSIGIYYDKTTSYFFVEEQYITDKNTGKLIQIPARRLNIILPTWSLRLHGQFFRLKHEAENSRKRMLF